MEVKNRISEALELRNMKQTELAERSGISKGTINNWLKNKYQPKQKSLMILASILDVSELWLAGYDIPKERPLEQVKADKLARLVQRLRKNDKLFNLSMSMSELTDEELTAIENMVKLLRRE